MGLYLLNLSVDSIDIKPEFVPEDLSYNEQESIVEIIIEQVLGYEDAFKEFDDQNRDDSQIKKNGKIDLMILDNKNFESLSYYLMESCQSYVDHEARLKSRYKQIVSPPPKS